jgi:hypothetical protein
MIGQHLNELPAILAELHRIVKVHADGKTAGVHYTCNPIGRRDQPHRLTVWIAGRPDRDFYGATFGEAYRPCYDFVRQDPAAAVESWLEDFADMVGGGADLGRPGFYQLQTPASGLTDPPLTAEERDDYHGATPFGRCGR